MKIFLVRHGIAVDLGEHGVKSDADRMLSTVGKRRVKDIALALKRLGAVPERIASSPLTRARETAEIFSNHLGTPVKVEKVLSLGMEPKAAHDWLRRQSVNSLMLVGHQPDLSRLASHLITGTDRVDIRFKKGGVCCVSFNSHARATHAALEWLMQPRQSRAIGEPRG